MKDHTTKTTESYCR